MDPLVRQLEDELRAHYRIERELGGGGMSRVFLAKELGLSRDVVVKVLPPELAASVNAERFRREIQLGAQLQHPHIVPLLTAGAGDSLMYYTMPYVAGESLRERLGRQPALSVHEATRIWHDLLDALAYAHSRGVIHRDIKPENILLSDRHAMVTDFGIARAVQLSTGEQRMTATGLALGTPAYMAPEQAMGESDVDHRADIYSAGLVMYEMLTGASPFGAASPREMLAAQLTRQPAPILPRDPSCSNELRALVMRCIEKEPSVRPKSADALLAELESSTTPQPTRALRRRRAPWLISATTVLVVVFGVAAWSVAAGRLPFGTPVRPGNDSLRLGVLLADNKYDAADSLLARNFADAVLSDLAADPWLRVVRPAVLSQMAQFFGFSPAKINRDTLILFAKRGHTSAYVSLGLSRAGAGWVFTAGANGSKNDNSVGIATAAANSPSDIPAAMHHVSAELRKRLVSARSELPHTEFKPLETDVSPDALQLFEEGSVAFDQRDLGAAAEKYRQAVQVDSTFVDAWSRLAYSLGNTAERRMAYAKAYGLRDRLRSPVRRLDLVGNYWRSVGRDDLARIAFDSLIKLIPEGLDGFVNNAGLTYDELRRYDISARLYRRAIDNSYQFLFPAHSNLVRALVNGGKMDEARAELARLDSANSSNPTTNQARQYFLTATRDWAGLERLAAGVLEAPKPPKPSLASRLRSMLSTGQPSSQRSQRSVDARRTALARAVTVAAVSGQFNRADSLRRQSSLLLTNPERPETRLVGALQRAFTEAALLGDTLHARAMVDSALKSVPWQSMQPRDRPYVNVLSTLASLGDRARADSIVADWSRSFPAEFKMTDSLDVLAARGDVMVATGDAREALRLYQLADVRGCIPCFYPRYARAYDQLKRRDSAVVWYEKYLSAQSPDLGVVDTRELARAYRRLGELYEERSEWKKAMERYQEFVTLWSKADPSLQPSVRDVKARIERLRARAG